MKFFTPLLGLVLGLAAAAPFQALASSHSYKIDIEYLAPDSAGNVPRTGSAIVQENESGKVQMADTLVRFLPMTTENGDIKINALIVKRSGKSEHIVGQPSVTVKEGQAGEISEMDESGKLLYKLRLTPRLN